MNLCEPQRELCDIKTLHLTSELCDVNLPSNQRASQQWRSEAKCRPGPSIKVPPFPPLKFAYKNLKWKKIMFRAYKRYKGQSNSHEPQRVSLFIVDLWFLLSLLAATFLIITLTFFLLSYILYIYGSGIFRPAFFPFGF